MQEKDPDYKAMYLELYRAQLKAMDLLMEAVAVSIFIGRTSKNGVCQRVKIHNCKYYAEQMRKNATTSKTDEKSKCFFGKRALFLKFACIP